MRIGVDCRLSGPQHAGIGRYITNLITRLPNLDQQTTWVYFVADRHQAAGFEKLPNVEVVIAGVPHYSLAEQWELPSVFAKAKLDLLHVPHFNVPLRYSQPLVITIHDLLWHEYKGSHVTTLSSGMYWFKYWAYRFVTTQAIRKAKAILVPAQVIKKTISTYYPEEQSKVVVTPEGVSGDFIGRQLKGKILSKLPADKKLLLYVGSLYPHKNVVLAIKALTHLPDYHLVIVGARNVFQDAVKKQTQALNVSQQVTFLGYVEDQDLAVIMAHSFALIQPSLSEGFGLTGVEAMAAGLPVLASQIPVFEEVYGKAATFFDPLSENSFVEAVHKLEKSDRKRLVTTGLSQSQKYSWDVMAEKTLSVYRQVLATSQT